MTFLRFLEVDLWPCTFKSCVYFLFFLWWIGFLFWQLKLVWSIKMLGVVFFVLKKYDLRRLFLRPDMVFLLLWVRLLWEIRVFFLLLVMNWFFVLIVETSLIDRDGSVFMSSKGNILGTLVLRRAMMFFSLLWVCLSEIRVLFVLLTMSCFFVFLFWRLKLVWLIKMVRFLCP